MNMYFRLSVLMSGATIAPVSFAQVTGYDIAWGVQAVPLSPTLTVLIALMMGLATWAFMRKRRGSGLIAAIAAIALGATAYNSDLVAAPFDFTIGSPAGSAFVACPDSNLDEKQVMFGRLIGTTLPGGVTLTRVEPNFTQAVASLDLSAQLDLPEECKVGTRLTPELPCAVCRTFQPS